MTNEEKIKKMEEFLEGIPKEYQWEDTKKLLKDFLIKKKKSIKKEKVNG